MPVGDHRRNGKIERCIRTITELLRPNKRRILQKSNRKFSEKVFKLRTAKVINVSLPAELQFHRQQNITVDLRKPSYASNSEIDPKFQLETNDIP